MTRCTDIHLTSARTPKATKVLSSTMKTWLSDEYSKVQILHQTRHRFVAQRSKRVRYHRKRSVRIATVLPPIPTEGHSDDRPLYK